jgi:hypothetical protein
VKEFWRRAKGGLGGEAFDAESVAIGEHIDAAERDGAIGREGAGGVGAEAEGGIGAVDGGKARGGDGEREDIVGDEGVAGVIEGGGGGGLAGAAIPEEGGDAAGNFDGAAMKDQPAALLEQDGHGGAQDVEPEKAGVGAGAGLDGDEGAVMDGEEAEVFPGDGGFGSADVAGNARGGRSNFCGIGGGWRVCRSDGSCARRKSVADMRKVRRKGWRGVMWGG